MCARSKGRAAEGRRREDWRQARGGGKEGKGRDECVYVCGGCQGIKRFYGMLRLSFSFLFFLRFWVSILLPLFSRALGTNFNFTDHAFGFALMVNLTPAADSGIMRSAVVGTTRDMLRPPIFYGSCEKGSFQY